MNAIFTKPFPTRPVSQGTTTLAASGFVEFSGGNARQARKVFIVANLSTTLALKLCLANASHSILTTIWPQTTLAFETDADLAVCNPNGSSVDFEVLELFYNEGTAPQLGASRSQGATPGLNNGSADNAPPADYNPPSIIYDPVFNRGATR